MKNSSRNPWIGDATGFQHISIKIDHLCDYAEMFQGSYMMTSEAGIQWGSSWDENDLDFSYYVVVEDPDEIVNAIQSGAMNHELKHRMLAIFEAAATERYDPKLLEAMRRNMALYCGSLKMNTPLHAVTERRSVAEPNVREVASSFENKIAAADALDSILRRLQCIETGNDRYSALLRELPAYLGHYGHDAMFEIQHAVLGERYSQEIRSDVLEALSRMEAIANVSAAYREWITSQALKSQSHFVRDAAITAWSALGGEPLRLRVAAEHEPVRRIKARMEKVASLLERRRNRGVVP